MTASIKILVLRTAGTNCDREQVLAWQKAAAVLGYDAQIDLRHINQIAPTGASEAIIGQALDQYHILAMPGGFAYGDDLGAGKLLANDLIYRLRQPFADFVARGKPVLGVCNGFQVLAKTGLFGSVTLAPNIGGYQCRWVDMRNVNAGKCIFTRGLSDVQMPVAHGEGRVVFGAETDADKYAAADQVVLVYSNGTNPNGSTADIAGLCNATGTVFGLMPHPERFVARWQHPAWTRQTIAEGDPETAGGGLPIFTNALQYVQNAL